MEHTEQVPISQAVKEWLLHIRRFTKTTQVHYRMIIRRFAEGLPIKTIGELSTHHLNAYIDRLLESYKNRTGNSHLTGLKSFCRWLSETYDMPNVAEKIKLLKEDPPEPRVLTWQEYKIILPFCKEQEKDWIKFLANTGLRASEMLNLKWRSVSEDYHLLTITGKGRKRRYVPLNKTSQECLEKYEREPDDCRIGFLVGLNNRSSLYSRCKCIARRAGIKRFGPHALRHLFATELLCRGVPISYVSQALGHASIKTTETIYIHFQPSFLNGVTDILDEQK